MNEWSIIIKCPHLIKWVLYSCNAQDEIYFPSALQLEGYCKKKNHKKCPSFRTADMYGAPGFEHEVFAEL